MNLTETKIWNARQSSQGSSIVGHKQVPHRTFTLGGITIQCPALIDFSKGTAIHAHRKGLALYALPAGYIINELGEFI